MFRTSLQDYSLNRCYEVDCRPDRRAAAYLYQVGRQPSTGWFLSKLEKDSGELLLRALVHDVGRSPLDVRPHTHVQRSLPQKAESSRRRLELVRGEAQIQEHTVQPGNAQLSKPAGDVRKIRFNETDPEEKQFASLLPPS